MTVKYIFEQHSVCNGQIVYFYWNLILGILLILYEVFVFLKALLKFLNNRISFATTKKGSYIHIEKMSKAKTFSFKKFNYVKWCTWKLKFSSLYSKFISNGNEANDDYDSKLYIWNNYLTVIIWPCIFDGKTWTMFNISKTTNKNNVK